MRAWRIAALVGLWAACLTAPAAHGQVKTLAIGQADSYALGPALDVLVDDSAAMRIDDVADPAQSARFQAAPRGRSGTNFGISSAAIWLRVTLDAAPDAPAQWLLELAYPPMDRMELWLPRAGGGHDLLLAGDQIAFSQRPVAHRNHVLPVRLVPGQPTTLYVRLTSEGTLSAPLRLWQPAALWRSDQASYATLSLYFGLLGGLLLYNLLLFLSVRDRGYLVYVAFAAGMAVAQAALTGLGLQFAWREALWWNSVSVPVGICMAAIFGLLFAREFLGSAARMPLGDRLIRWQVGAWLLTLAAAVGLPYIWSTWMVSLLAPVSVASLVLCGAVSVRRGYPGARYFLGAWTVLLVGAFAMFLHNVGVLPSNAFTRNALLIGSSLEMVLLSFALGGRINDARRFHEQAQARIAAEQAMVQVLEESRQRLQTVLGEREVILENSIVGIAFLTPGGRFKWANKAMLDIFGGGGEPIASMEPFYLSREQYLEVGGEVAAAVARGQAYERELPVQRGDGTRIWIQLSGKAVNRSDLSQGTVWVVMDITDRKTLEAQLRTAMSEREAILNNALVGIVLSVNRTHEWVNAKFAQMLGYPRQILIGQSSAHIHPDEEAWTRFGVEARAALIAHGSYDCERQLKRRSGELFWVQMGGSCVRPHDPDSGVIWTFLDITGRKESEAGMREALDQQKALNELRTRFVAMTSHEFRTPLAAILSAEQLLRHYGDRLPQDERLEILDSVAGGVQRMSRMLDRVLLLGQADAQMLDYAPEVLDLPRLCRALVDEARAQHAGMRCEVVAQWGPDVGLGVYDEKLLRHIFGNLLSNAIKYSPTGGTVRFSVARQAQATVFEVADQGIGIPEAEIGHLFESFHRASNVGSIPGTGLGLAIVKNAVQMHGGRIEVRSTMGRGTCFTVHLPAAA